MPIVALPERHLFNKLGKEYTESEIDKLCFDYGLELDEITSEKEMLAREQGSKKAENCSEEKVYKIEVPANRSDLLCTEGLTKAFQIFQKKIPIPTVKKIIPNDPIVMNVTSHVKEIRQFVVCAVLRDVKLDSDAYNSLIDLQDKLHQNICRKRKLVAIGTHDLDTLKPPFLYDAVDRKSFSFIPLNETKPFTGDELMTHYSNSHLKPYLNIISNNQKFPLIKDSAGTVLSMPPIINGDVSKVSLMTKNIFIECTATDLNRAEVVLDTLVSTFSEYCKDKFSVECVKTVYHDKTTKIYPSLSYREETLCLDYVNNLLGTNLKLEELIELLGKMGLKASISKVDPENKLNLANRLVSVIIPPDRHDILHPCDIAEDVAIAYGYDRIEEVLPTTYCIAEIQPINRLTSLLRPEIAQAGFTEVLSFSLCSSDDVSKNLLLNLNDVNPVVIDNPRTLEFQVVRTTLLPGILRTLASNKSQPLPLKLFEVQDVVHMDSKSDVGCRQTRNVAAIYYGKTSGFEVIHGLVDKIMQLLETFEESEIDFTNKRHKMAYKISQHNLATYFPGRCAQISVCGIENGKLTSYKEIGHFGVLHPEVIKNFGLNNPCSALEINLECFI